MKGFLSSSVALAFWIGSAGGLLPTRAAAHGDTHEMVRVLNEEIRQNPRDADAYFRRGELNRRHGEFDLALHDYELAQRYSTNTPMLDLARGLLYVEAKWPNSAKLYLDRFLSRETNHVIGLSARAKAFLQLTNRAAAVADYTAAIRSSAEPRPELYLERAQILITEDGKHLDEAIAGLDEGAERLGSVITLRLHAIELELRRRQTNAAIARLDQLIARSPRKETWYARKGEILQQAGRFGEAKTAYSQALDHLKSLPPSRRNVPAIQEFEKRIREALEAVQK
ncbi:MAG: tetratricopeptide repeat protein [Verrucomicrobiales bacterium]|nr:tetratricopeptide repeat protein [Verrucomicrobiales bacterium]